MNESSVNFVSEERERVPKDLVAAGIAGGLAVGIFYAGLMTLGYAGRLEDENGLPFETAIVESARESWPLTSLFTFCCAAGGGLFAYGIGRLAVSPAVRRKVNGAPDAIESSMQKLGDTLTVKMDRFTVKMDRFGEAALPVLLPVERSIHGAFVGGAVGLTVSVGLTAYNITENANSWLIENTDEAGVVTYESTMTAEQFSNTVELNPAWQLAIAGGMAGLGKRPRRYPNAAFARSQLSAHTPDLA